jgi:hypothetical protein
VKAEPRDMNSIPGYSGDYRTLEKLINSVKNTSDDHDMWLIPFNKGDNHSITIEFNLSTAIRGIKFYNYNKGSTEEDSLRGVKAVTISLDGKMITPKRGVLIRKAPGVGNIEMD